MIDLKAKLRALEPTLILHSGGANPDLVEMLCEIGCDAIYVDCERSSVGIETVVGLRRAAHAMGVPVLVRSYAREPELLVRYLDTGVDGLIVPRVDTPEQAQTLVDLMRYVSGRSAHKRVLVAQVESQLAIENLNSLFAIEELDAFFLGPMDLAFEMKVPQTDPRVTELLDEVITRAHHAKRAAGLPVTQKTIASYVAKGATYLSCRLPSVLEIGLSQTKHAITQGLSQRSTNSHQ